MLKDFVVRSEVRSWEPPIADQRIGVLKYPGASQIGLRTASKPFGFRQRPVSRRERPV